MNTIIIDSNYICNISKHALKGFSFHEKKTGVIFGFLRTMLTLYKKFHIHKFVFTWDSAESVRKAEYLQYKANRHQEKTPEEIALDTIAYPQFNLLRTYILPTIGFRNSFQWNGYEADDIIANLVVTPHSGIQAVVVSADNDLYQLLDYCVMYDPRFDRTFTVNDFKKEWGISPKLWVNVKMIAGCKGDNVLGVPGVKNITAIKFLTTRLGNKTQAYKAITENADLIESNKSLVELPKDRKEFALVNDEFDISNFIKVCDEYGLYSFMKGSVFDSWKELLGIS